MSKQNTQYSDEVEVIRHIASANPSLGSTKLANQIVKGTINNVGTGVQGGRTLYSVLNVIRRARKSNKATA